MFRVGNTLTQANANLGPEKSWGPEVAYTVRQGRWSARRFLCNAPRRRDLQPHADLHAGTDYARAHQRRRPRHRLGAGARGAGHAHLQPRHSGPSTTRRDLRRARWQAGAAGSARPGSDRPASRRRAVCRRVRFPGHRPTVRRFIATISCCSTDLSPTPVAPGVLRRESRCSARSRMRSTRIS